MLDFVNSFIEKKVEIEDKKLFQYGLSSLIKYLILLNITLFFSIKYRYILSSLIFIFVFILIKTNIGGFHFQNKYICFIVSLLVINVVPIIIQFYPIKKTFSLLLGIVCSIFILTICPISSKNKKLKYEDIIYYKKNIKRIIFIIFILYFILLKLNLVLILNSLSAVLICITIDIVIHIIGKRRDEYGKAT